MVKVCSVQELQEVIRAKPSLRLCGLGSKERFRMSAVAGSEHVQVALSGIVEHHVDDQVLVVKAGTPVDEVQTLLREKGQCLPLPANPMLSGYPGTVAGSLSMNLPHALQAACGSWRDWILGLTLVRADGTLAKSGSKAVKNVAGYDVHKLMIGARGTLGVIVEVTLRTMPLKSVPAVEAVVHQPDATPVWVQRTRRTDYAAARQNAGRSLIAEDPASCTLWIGDAQPTRMPYDWVLGLLPASFGIREGDRTLMERAKRILDPEARLNPGEFGFL